MKPPRLPRRRPGWGWPTHNAAQRPPRDPAALTATKHLGNPGATSPLADQAKLPWPQNLTRPGQGEPMTRTRTVALLAGAACASGLFTQIATAGSPRGHRADAQSSAEQLSTTTPIKHLVVIFQENVSFDHYFGTYPYAANPDGEPPFHPAAGTPAVNGLSGALLSANPNLFNPQRLD